MPRSILLLLPQEQGGLLSCLTIPRQRNWPDRAANDAIVHPTRDASLLMAADLYRMIS